MYVYCLVFALICITIFALMLHKTLSICNLSKTYF